MLFARGLALLGAAAFVSVASASFDMAVLLHNFGGATQVSRWDAPTGRYLGSFGRGILSNAVSVNVSPLNDGEALVGFDGANTIGYRRFDYSTGEYRGLFTTNATSTTIAAMTSFNNGDLAFAGSFNGAGQIRVYGRNMILKRTINYPVSTTFLDVVAGSDGVLYTLSREAGSTSDYRFVLSSFAAEATVRATGLILLDNVVSSTRFQSLSMLDGRILIGGETSTGTRHYAVTGTSFGGLGLMSGLSTPSSVVLGGHTDVMYSYGYDSITPRLRFGIGSLGSTIWGDSIDNTSSTFTNSVILDGDMVLAPEPGTMLALGAGLAALLARRRRR